MFLNHLLTTPPYELLVLAARWTDFGRPNTENSVQHDSLLRKRKRWRSDRNVSTHDLTPSIDRVLGTRPTPGSTRDCGDPVEPREIFGVHARGRDMLNIKEAPAFL